jgi:hypothetical protein
VNGQIFELSFIEFEAIQMFLYDEVIQNIVNIHSGDKSHEELKNEPHDDLDDELNVKFEVKKYDF